MVARTAAAALLAACAFLLGCQERMMYYPRAYNPAETRYFLESGGVALAYTTAHGAQRAFFKPGREGCGRVWIVCAGNGSLALELSDFAPDWDGDAGWLFVDYPGYGGNAGRPSPSAIRHSLLGAVDALAAHLKTTREALIPRLGVAGQSLGAAAALIVADELGLQKAVLFSPFTTMTEMGRIAVGWPLCHLNRHRYDNRARLASFVARGGRAWIVHGVDDEIIPVRMGRELAAAHPSSVTLTEAPGTHNDLWFTAPGALAAAFRAANHPAAHP